MHNLRLESKHFAFIVFWPLISMTFLVKCYSLWHVNSVKEVSVCFTAVSQPQNNVFPLLCSRYIFIKLRKKCDSSYTLVTRPFMFINTFESLIKAISSCSWNMHYNHAYSFMGSLDSITHIYEPQVKKFYSSQSNGIWFFSFCSSVASKIL